MFGYVNVNRTQLNKEDEITYQRFYCGLCRKLKDIAGPRGQMLLNYDMTFLVILLSGLYESENDLRSFRCVIHPVSQKHAYVNEITEYAAAMDIILSYHSLKDDETDDKNPIKGVMAKSIKSIYDKVSVQYPEQTKLVERYITNLAEAEKAGETNIDVVSNFTGEMLGELFSYRHDMWEKELKSLGFYLGKYIYILDAYDDLQKDICKGRYNPLIALKQENPNGYECFVKATLNSLMAECAKSFERLPILEYTDILRNIIYSGVWTKYEYLQLKKKKETKE